MHADRALGVLRVCARPVRAAVAWLVSRARRRSLVAGALALVLCVAAWLAAGSALESWAIGLGMDEQRAALIAGLIVVLGGAAGASLAAGHAAATRAGSLLALCAVGIVPFVVGSIHAPTTPGLTARVLPGGWVAQPLGMLLLGWLAATTGSAVGMLLRSDALGLWVRLRRRRVLWMALLPALAVVTVGWRAAGTALQDGPLADLYTYATAPAGVPAGVPGTGPRGEAQVPELVPGAAERHTSSGAGARGSAVPAVRHLRTLAAGDLEPVHVDGRAVDVYLPAAYASEPTAAFPVVYFLHGFPGTESQWFSGGQLPAVLDQLIDDRVIPPLIGVLPDGAGTPTADSEWGDTAKGGAVEDWLVDRVVPAVDGHFRSLGARYRGIAGLSSGGFGAVNLAFRHPDQFSWAASYSGFFNARPDLFGTTAEANSPTQTAPTLADTERMPLYIGVGTIDREFLGDNRSFVNELRHLDWPELRTEVVPGGHGWQAWRQQLVDSLEWLGRLWAPGHLPSTHAAPVA